MLTRWRNTCSGFTTPTTTAMSTSWSSWWTHFCICICHCICVVYDGYADFVYLSDGTLCSDDLLHYEWWLSRRGLGQNLPRLWCEQVTKGWTGFIFLLQNFFSYIIDCCSIDARFWYCILMGTIHMKISIQLFCDGPVCWTHGSWLSHEENWGNGPYLIKTSAPDLNTLTLDRELAQENVVRKKW